MSTTTDNRLVSNGLKIQCELINSSISTVPARLRASSIHDLTAFWVVLNVGPRAVSTSTLLVATAAAARGKHVLLEKPTALCAADLDAILAACDASGVQFMDSTMWMHHPRTAKMRQLVADQDTIGDVRFVSARNTTLLC